MILATIILSAALAPAHAVTQPNPRPTPNCAPDDQKCKCEVIGYCRASYDPRANTITLSAMRVRLGVR